MRLYNKADEAMLAALVAERDQLESGLATERSNRIIAHELAEQHRKSTDQDRQRIQFLEAELAKYMAAQNEMMNRLLAANTESNAPVKWPTSEQVKVEARIPRSALTVARHDTIVAALKARKSEKVQ